MRLLLLLTFLISSILSFAQKDFQITGRWNVVSIESEDMKIQFQHDSLVVSGALKEKYDNSPELKATISEYISYFKTMYFEFFEKGFFTVKHDTKLLDEGTFTVDQNKKTITLSSVNSNGIKTQQVMSYDLRKKANTIKMIYDDGGMVLLLQK